MASIHEPFWLLKITAQGWMESVQQRRQSWVHHQTGLRLGRCCGRHPSVQNFCPVIHGTILEVFKSKAAIGSIVVFDDRISTEADCGNYADANDDAQTPVALLRFGEEMVNDIISGKSTEFR